MTRALRALRRDGLESLLGRVRDRLTRHLDRSQLGRDRATLQGSALFDPQYYLDRYPDVERAGIPPLEHFLARGWREGRRPHPFFDTPFYLAANPDVARSGGNPLVHFVVAGLGEGRRPSAWFDEALELPLPEWAFEPGVSRVERVVRTFALRRADPLDAARVDELLRAIQGLAAGQEKLRPPAASDAPDASLLIPVFNQLKLTLWCLHAVLAGAYRHTFEIVVVDDASTDGTAAALAALPFLRSVRHPGNRGFVHACTSGARQARGRHLVFLNNDTLPLPGWLDALLDTFADRPDAGLVGAKLIYPDGRLQEAGGIVWQDGSAWNFGRDGDRRAPEVSYRRPVDFCSGAALAVSASLFEGAGGFDPALAPAYGEDLDLALRLRAAGRDVLYQPLAEVVHVEGATAGTSVRSGVKATQVRNLEVLARRWRRPLRAHRPAGLEPRLEKDRGVERRALFADLFTPRPDEDAGSRDAVHWMRSLLALGYHVTFLSTLEEGPPGRAATLLRGQGVHCVEGADAIEGYLAAQGATLDLCVFYRYQTAERMMPAVERWAPQARRLLAVCDLTHVRLARQAELAGTPAAGAQTARLAELLACARSDALVTPSTAEADLLRRELPGVPVFSWPLAQELRPPRRSFGERGGVGFLGGYRHAPNVDAVLHFVREVLPLVLKEEPGITFTVAGSHPTPEIAGLDHPAVRVLGPIADLDALFETVRVCVAPLRFGAGFKGKVAASLAAGLPVVATTVALEGMGLEAEEGVLRADTPEEIARAVVRLHRDEALWQRLSGRGLLRAERDWTPAAGTRHLARALVEIGAGTRRAEECLAADAGPPRFWPEIGGMHIEVCAGPDEHRALRASAEWRRRAELEERLLRQAGGGPVLCRAYSVPAALSVVYRADVSHGADGRPQARWREELVCPVTGLNNRQRALAAFAQRLLTAPGEKVDDVYLTEQATPFFRWITGRFRTVSVTGSEYLGPGLAGGTVRDGLQHQDVEHLSFPTASLDLVLSLDVLEHVNEPQQALAELARVLRPGGHLLFTVPFDYVQEKNRRRARDGAGTVEHLVEPCYHGDPLRPEGALAYFDYGWELLSWIAGAGFRDVRVLCYWSDSLGHLGAGQLQAFYALRC